MRKFFITTLLTMALLSNLVISTAFSAAAAAAADKEAFKAMLIEVLKENPEILFDIMKENDSKFIQTITSASESARVNELEAKWQQDKKIIKNFTAEKRPMLGDKNAPNTLYVFSDFLCTYCQKTAGTVETFIKQHKDVKLVFKAYPKNDDSKIALRWFYLMNQKDSQKAWQLHDTIFVHQQAYAANPLQVLKEIVRQQGYDPESIAKEAESKKAELDALINEDISEAKQYQVTGTPYLFINNLVLVGTQNLTTLESALKFSLK